MTKESKPPSRTADQFVIRLPEGMRERIAKAAKENNRSMNAEIVSVLQDYYRPTLFDAGLPIDTSEMSAEEALAMAVAEYQREFQRVQDGLLESIFAKYGINTLSFKSSEMKSSKPTRKKPAK